MRAAVTCSVFGLFVVAAVVYAQSPPPDLQKAREARSAAQNAGDEQGWARYTTDDFMVVNPTGDALTKAERMAAIKGNKVANPPAQTDLKWRVYGDAALETFVLTIPAGPTRFTTVWVKQGGMWKVANVQQTLITKKP